MTQPQNDGTGGNSVDQAKVDAKKLLLSIPTDGTMIVQEDGTKSALTTGSVRPLTVGT